MIELGFAFTAMLIAALILRDRCGAWTAATLLTNWGVLTWIAAVTNEPYNPGIAFAVDYTAAWVLFMVCRSRVQILVIGLFALEIISHAARMVLEPTAWSAYVGWWFLFYVACAQAVICGGGIVGGGLKSVLSRRHALGSPFAGKCVHNGMAQDAGAGR